MEEKEKQTNDVNTFKTVQNQNTYKALYSEPLSRKKIGFGKSVLLPFFSGIIGCGIVLRYLLWCSFYTFKNFECLKHF